MSNIDKQVLRQLAGKATKGEWVVFAKPTPTYFDAIHSLAALLNGTVGDQKTLYMIDANGLCPALTGTGPNSANNAEFIAAANPSTVLVLLDELEAKDRRLEEEIGRANREHHRGFMMACGHLKEHSNVHYADAAEMEMAALRKRINELESAAAGKGE